MSSWERRRGHAARALLLVVAACCGVRVQAQDPAAGLGSWCALRGFSSTDTGADFPHIDSRTCGNDGTTSQSTCEVGGSEARH